MSRILKFGKYNDGWMSSIPSVVKHRIRYRRGPPPRCETNDPAVREELIRLLLLDEVQRASSQGRNPQVGPKEFHIRALFKLLNFTLRGKLLWHYCQGCCDSQAQCITKITYHFVSPLELLFLCFSSLRRQPPPASAWEIQTYLRNKPRGGFWG